MEKQTKFQKLNHLLFQCGLDMRDAHVAAYSARSAFFLIVSLFPCLILLIAFLNVTPFTEAELISVVQSIFPDTISPLIVSTVKESFSTSSVVVPLTIVTALWSAGKGVMAISDGLNCIHDILETRNYFFLRARAAVYTVFFLFMLVALLILQAFGESLGAFILSRRPGLENTIGAILQVRRWAPAPIIMVMTLLVYKFLPNRKIRFFTQLPGSVFCYIGWSLCSTFFSYYLAVFTGFSNIYGSLTTVVLIMLWFYFIMYILLLGAQINLWLKRYRVLEKIPFFGKRYREKEEKFIEKTRLHNMTVMRIREEKIKKHPKSAILSYGQEEEDKGAH